MMKIFFKYMKALLFVTSLTDEWCTFKRLRRFPPTVTLENDNYTDMHIISFKPVIANT